MVQNEAVKDAKKVVVDLTMTVEDARLVKWMGKHSDESVGSLLDSGQLTKRDLAWAVESAYNAKCREASRTLLAYWLGQPTTLEVTKRYGPEVITGTNYLKEQALDRIMELSGLIGVLIGSVLMFAAFGLPQEISKWIDLSNQGKPALIYLRILVSLAVLGLGAWYFSRNAKRRLQDYRAYSEGSEGEDRIVERLRSVLDNRWTIFRNLVLPNRKEDVDLVLVGPGGVWAIQVKSHKRTLRAQGGTWEISTKKGWVPAAQNPHKEVSSHAKQLNIYLQQKGITRWVERAIALATDQPISYFKDSEIPVWLLPTIENDAAHLSTRTPPTEQESKKIVEILKRLNDVQTTKRK